MFVCVWLFGNLLFVYLFLSLVIIVEITWKWKRIWWIWLLSVCGRNQYNWFVSLFLSVYLCLFNKLHSEFESDHLLFRCDPFSNVWSAVLQWLHLSFIAPSWSRNHFYQFGHMTGLLRSSHTFFRVIWLACVWII